MCSIKGCEDKPIARGLCAKHYMRLRRTGTTDDGRKPGRPPDEVLALIRTMVSDYSPRTIARYARAMRLLDVLDDKSKEEIVRDCTRPNGSFNTSKFLMLAELIYKAASEDE
jgi:hypothetical protein